EALRLADDDRFRAPRAAAELRAGALAAAGPGGPAPRGGPRAGGGGAGALAAAGAGVPAPGGDPDAGWSALRRFKRREFVRIATRDLLGVEASTEQVGAELAALGEACLEAALALALRAQGERPLVRLALIGMGKLGGAELDSLRDGDVLDWPPPAG